MTPFSSSRRSGLAWSVKALIGEDLLGRLAAEQAGKGHVGIDDGAVGRAAVEALVDVAVDRGQQFAAVGQLGIGATALGLGGAAFGDQGAEHERHADHEQFEQLQRHVTFVKVHGQEGAQPVGSAHGHDNRRERAGRHRAARTEPHGCVERHEQRDVDDHDARHAVRADEEDGHHEDRLQQCDRDDPQRPAQAGAPGSSRQPAHRHRHDGQDAERIHAPPAVPAGVEGDVGARPQDAARQPRTEDARQRRHGGRDADRQDVAQPLELRPEAEPAQERTPTSGFGRAAERRPTATHPARSR